MHYRDYSDDVVVNSGQAYELPADYVYVRTSALARCKSAMAYGAAKIFAFCYCRLHMGIRIEGREKLRKFSSRGLYVYGNHTQPLSDVFLPVLISSPGRAYAVCSPANLGLPLIGRLLPALGAIPTPANVTQARRFSEAVSLRAGEGCVFIYPEGHLWPYYTGIRPFNPSSFSFPASDGRPAFAVTMVYNKPERGSRPRMTAYIDGPFFADRKLPRKQRQAALCESVREAMLARASASDCEYVRYIKD